jgi:hypothetical protein
MATLSNLSGISQTKRNIFANNPATIGNPILTDSLGATLHSLNYSRNYTAATYGNGFYVFGGMNDEAGYEGYVNYSDGTNWTGFWGAAGTYYPYIAFGAGRHLIASNSTTAGYYSATYGAVYGTTFPATPSGLYFLNNQFILTSGSNIYTSADGITWSSAKATPASFVKVGYGNGLYIGTDNAYPRVFTSTDLTTWSTRNFANFSYPSFQSYCVAYGNGKYVVLGNTWYYATTTNAFYSTDGINWTVTTMPQSRGWRSVVYANNCFVAVGASAGQIGSNTATGPSYYVAYSPDGINWSSKKTTIRADWGFVNYINSKYILMPETIYVDDSTVGKGNAAYWMDATAMEVVYQV